MLKRFRKFKTSLKYLDLGIICCFLILSTIGIVMVYSASMVSASKGALTGGIPIQANFFMKRQFVFAMFGFLLIIFRSIYFNINALKKRNTQKFIVFGTLLLLLLTQLIGKDVNGSKNWVNVGIFNLQSSEFLKLAAIFYLAFIIDRLLKINKNYKLKNLIPPLGLLGVGLVCVLMQGDLGGTLLTVGIIASILIYSDIKNKIKLQILSITAIPTIIYIFYTLVFDANTLYRMKRIKVLFDPFKYENGDGYQLTNALLSISNGGISGRGLGNGILKLGYLPEPHTDFIFTVIAEELGLVGIILVLLLYAIIIYKGFYYANKTTNHFYKLICIGVMSYLFMQIFINTGGVSGLIPLTGITLPLLSYGGSSMLSVSIALGSMLAVIREIKKESEINHKNI